MAQTSEQVINLLQRKAMDAQSWLDTLNHEIDILFNLIGEAKDVVYPDGTSALAKIHQLVNEAEPYKDQLFKAKAQIARIQNGEDPTYVLVSE